jgi:hypothetical protein
MSATFPVFFQLFAYETTPSATIGIIGLDTGVSAS